MSRKIANIADLTPDARNANKGTQRGRGMVEASLREVGAGRSIVVDKEGRVIAGNKTLEAAADIGLEIQVVHSDGQKLFVVQRDDLDLSDDTGAARKLAYLDNRASETGLAWDAEVMLADLNAGVDLSGIFNQDELDALLAGLLPPEPITDPGPQVDKADELRQKWGVELGQMWQLGDHRLICGDCTDKATVARLMGGERAQAVLTDPPFNIGLDYDIYDDKKPESEYLAMMFICFSLAREITDKSNHLLCTLGHNATWPVRAEIEKAGWTFRHIGVWHNPQRKAGGNPGMWPFAWESVMDFTNGGFRKLNNSNGVGYMDVWIEASGTDTDHPAERPLVTWCELLELISSRNDIVYEPFSGSGTTIIACEQLGRKCRAVEISPAYVAVALERWSVATNRTPELLTI
jgi:DNA modification methylase